jgi:RNA polymerase sigma-70 factor (ECF subfamily)
MIKNTNLPAAGPANYADDVDLGYIVDEFYGSVLLFAVGLTKSEADAADLAQQTFLTLSQKLHQIRDLSKIKCWLFTTVHRNFLRQVRHHRKHPEIEFRSDVHDIAIPHAEASRSLDAERILSAFSQVDHSYRAALEAFYLGELSYREIAWKLKIPLGTVMSRLSRGKEQLRAILLKEER